MSRALQLFEVFFLEFSWVIGFFLMCFFGFEQTMQNMSSEYNKFETMYNGLVEEKKAALATQQKKLLQINSQNDPKYRELILMEQLGLVPKGQTKIIFTAQ